MNDFNAASAYVAALTGNPDTIIDWRVIHDQNKDMQGRNIRGSLRECWQQLCDYNSQGWGVFCCINEMDGQGRKSENVKHIRTHVVDLDNVFTSHASYQQALNTYPLPSFSVQTSDNKYHIYWIVEPYVGNDFYTLHQRKIAQLYSGDETIIDAARVLRVPGFYHCKNEPRMVTFSALAGLGSNITYQIIEQSLAHVNIFHANSTRYPLGDESMSAPGMDWIRFAFSKVDPNDLDRREWLKFSAAIKQAAWLYYDENTLCQEWLNWCSNYSENDDGENLKLWNSVKDTEVGWPYVAKMKEIHAYIAFGFKEIAPPISQQENKQLTTQEQTAPTIAEEVTIPDEILDVEQCQNWFKDCYFIERIGEIFSRSGRFMNSTKFNGRYGGKNFIITSTGKITDEAWKAALRSTLWTVPKVDHVRFLPDHKTFEIITDALGRKGLNTYIPAIVSAKQGDMTLWFEWLDKILPDRNDQKILTDYLAHAAKYPGYKIPWAPMVQSTEGIGKTIFREVMAQALGDMYVYSPKAPELVKSGSTFNGWMRGKLLIVVDEIKIDERRELIEILKPMITDSKVEIQSKGVDQEMEDNPANWLFFSNYKDAIPISQNGRRYCIFYSGLQNRNDLLNVGMDDVYFNKLWGWLRDGGGSQAVAYWLLNHPIKCGELPVRSPQTSSFDEALKISRSPMETVIADCVSDNIIGFKAGYISVLKVIEHCKLAGIRTPTTRSVMNCLENMGYSYLGKAVRPYIQEHVSNRTELYGIVEHLSIDQYGLTQGYEL